VNKAVSDKTGKTKLYLSEGTNVDNRIYDSHDGRKSVEIQSIRLDDYFKGYKGKINFIKMDIQGAEKRAVEGMANLLKKNRDMKLISEFWPFGLDKFGTRPAGYLKLLQEQGFRIEDIDESEGRAGPVNAHSLLKRYTVKNGAHTNLFCRR
jgi:hypothetical protein